MVTFAQTFERAIEDFPRKILSEALEKKLRKKGIRLSKQKIDLMASRLLTGEPIDQPNFLDRLKARLGFSVRETSIEFTEDDTKSLIETTDKFIDGLPKIIEKILETVPPHFLESLKKKWPHESNTQRRVRVGFTKRLYDRWGEGLELLKMFITISREIGSNNNQSFRADPGNHKATEVLTRLHARACQISEEIVCLLENGFSDGAMARWRTLHEIAAVASLIRKHGNDLAERYAAHQVIESAKAARQFQKHHKRLNQPSFDSEEMKRIEHECRTLIGRYGKTFGNNYGWATEHIKKSDPTLAELFEAAGIDHLSPYYRMASHNVHANPKSIFFKLGLFAGSQILLAGPSNAGLADPGHATAISLLQITAALTSLNPTLDDLIALKVLERLEDEIGSALISAHQRLERDEQTFSGEDASVS